MKIHQPTKKQNKQWAFWYIVGSILLFIYGAIKNQYFLIVAGGILLGLAGYRLFWLNKRLKE